MARKDADREGGSPRYELRPFIEANEYDCGARH